MVGDFRGRKILQIVRKGAFRGENFHGMLNWLHKGVATLQQWLHTLAHIYDLEQQHQRKLMVKKSTIPFFILYKWLEGRGRKPMTRATLARVLHIIGKGELAGRLFVKLVLSKVSHYMVWYYLPVMMVGDSVLSLDTTKKLQMAQ